VEERERKAESLYLLSTFFSMLGYRSMQRVSEAYVITHLHLGSHEEPVCGRTSLLYLPLLQQPTAILLHILCELFPIEI